MSARMTCELVQESFGVLVLGAIDPIERARVEDHLLDCPTCPAVLAEFSALPGMLKRLDEVHIDPERPPQDLLDRIIAQVRTERVASHSHLTWLRPVAALAALAAVAVVAFTMVATRQDDSIPAQVADAPIASTVPVATSPATATATDPDTGVTATLTMSPGDVGTQLHVSVNGVVAGEHCEIVAVSTDGSREVAASWVAGYVGAAQVTGTTGFAAEDIARIEIATPDGKHLVTVPVNA